MPFKILNLSTFLVLSTGKRRFGHPALNGVLPEPWLPLKKGQTLTNHENRNNGSPRQGNDSNQAVVLTLRKRASVVRRSRLISRQTLTSESAANNSNPWQDAQSSTGRTQTAPNVIHHRLSFDHATGVIMIPDDENWLAEDVDSDEEDYGAAGIDRIQRTQTEPAISGSEVVSEDEDLPIAASPSRTSRYGTYFHHPERRRQTIPGAFPRPS